MIIISQDYPVRGYQIPSFGLRELTNGEQVAEDSKLGIALLKYFPSICIIEGESKKIEPIVAPEAHKPELLVEEPVEAAVVTEVEPGAVVEESKPAKKGRFGK